MRKNFWLKKLINKSFIDEWHLKKKHAFLLTIIYFLLSYNLTNLFLKISKIFILLLLSFIYYYYYLIWELLFIFYIYRKMVLAPSKVLVIHASRTIIIVEQRAKVDEMIRQLIFLEIDSTNILDEFEHLIQFMFYVNVKMQAII